MAALKLLFIALIMIASLFPTPTLLSAQSFSSGHISWSPDGNSIAFVFWKNSGYFAILNVATQEISHYFEGAGSLYSSGFDSIEWSLDSQWVAFETYFVGKLGSSETLYVMNMVSGQVSIAADAPYHSINCPTWSGSQLLFSRWSEIYIADLGQDTFSEAIAYLTLQEERPACQWWLPDNDHILFSTYGNQIYRLNLRNGSLVRLVSRNTPDYLSFPKLSPAGSHLLYFSDPHLYMMEVDSSSFIILTEGFEQAVITTESAYWSRDSRYIALQFNADIYLVSIDESNLINITAGHEDEAVYAGWSPDSSQIAFTSRGAIYAVDVEGSLPIRLTEAGLVAEKPVWSPDGTHLAFIVKNESGDDLYIMNEDGTETRRLAHLDTYTNEFAWSPDGQTIAVNHGNGKIGLYSLDGTVFTFFALIPDE